MWLLRAGRDICISDVDAAWIAPPYELLRSVPQARGRLVASAVL